MNIQAYEDKAAQQMYSLLFCDDLSLYKNSYKKLAECLPGLFSEQVDTAALTNLASDEKRESRLRMLAARRLKEAGAPLKENPVLGVVLEMPLDDGLDTLAVYRDGQARYINFSGRIAAFDKVPEEGLRLIFEEADKLVPANGPWAGKRLPPPTGEILRFTFFAGGETYVLEDSDGELFGENDAADNLFMHMSTLLRMIVQASRE